MSPLAVGQIPLCAAPLLALAAFVSMPQAGGRVEAQRLASGKGYLSYRPSEVATKPLLIVDLYHGQSPSGQKGASVGIQFWKNTPFRNIVIAPDYEGDDWKVYEDMHGGAADGKKAEIKYILECVDDAQRRFKIDQRRVVITGTSSGADYAFEIALANPARFCGVVPIVPGWCGRPARFDESAQRVHVYFLVGGADPRRKQVIDAYENLRKVTSNLVWRMHPKLGHERFPMEEIERAFRWQEEMLEEPSERTLKYAAQQIATEVPQAGIHLLRHVAANAREKQLVKRAQEMLQKIEKQAQRELSEAKKLANTKDPGATERLWLLYDRYGSLPLWIEVSNLIHKGSDGR